MKRISYASILTLIILIGLSSCNAAGRSSSNPPTSTSVGIATVSPTSASTPTPALTPTITTTPDTSGASQIITKYYNAIKVQNYPLAYTYLDSNAIDANGNRITLSSFEQMAQMMEREGGSVVSFSVAIFPSGVVMSITRTLLVYHAHLQVKQEDQTWKIISLDRI